MNSIEKATQYFNEENFIEAEKISFDILLKNPNDMDAIDVLAAILIRTGKLSSLDKITKKHITILYHMEKFLIELNLPEFAIMISERIIELDKRNHTCLNNLGLLYESIGLNNKAMDAYEKSIKIEPMYSSIYNLGCLHRQNKNIEKSLHYLKRAYQMEPDNPHARYSLAMTYLIDKNFKEGYPLFAFQRPGIPDLRCPWDGTAHTDKEILIFCEYGLGDALQFSRYFSLLKPLFKKVTVCCRPPLIQLFKDSFEGINFITNHETSLYDYSVLAMNLPYFLNLDFDNIPSANGYLKADELKIKKFKEKYFQNDKIKVGLFYLGGEQVLRNARYRSMPLENITPLLNLENIQLYSFQKDDLLDELKDFPQIIDLGKEFNDFTDTAAAMKNLDVFVTIDSSPVHLAGALGVKTFLMLPYYSEWRWFLDESKTPWYDSVELIRQSTHDQWSDIIQKIYNKLA